MSVETNNTTDLTAVIARRAYELYQLRGGRPGREFEDWLEAEKEVLAAALPTDASPAPEEAPAPKPARKRAAKTPSAPTAPRKRTPRKKSEE